jgi:hypothetical protein
MSNIYKFGTMIRLAQLATDPASAENGTMYYNKTTNNFRVYKNGSWADSTTGSVSLTGQVLSQNDILVGDGSNLSLAVGTSAQGDILADTSGLHIKSGVISDTNIASNAAIARNKMATGSPYAILCNIGDGQIGETNVIPNSVVITDNLGLLANAAVSIVELNYLIGVTSDIQTQLNTNAGAISALDFSPYLKHDGSVLLTGDLLPTGSPSVIKLGSTNNAFYDVFTEQVDFYKGGASSQALGSIKFINTFDDLEISTASTTGNIVLVPGAIGGAVNVSNAKIVNLLDPTNAQDAATQNYVLNGLATKLSLAGGTMTNNIAMGGHEITGLGAPTSANSAVRKVDLETALSGLDFQPDVLGVQLASVAAPGVPTSGMRYVLTTGSLDVSWGTIPGLGTNDIVQYNGASWFVAYDVSVQGPGALVWDRGTSTFQRWDGTSWSDFGGLAGITAGIGLSKTGNTLDVNLGAGIAQLPTDEVGLDLYSSSGLFLTVDGSTASTLTNAQLSILLDGTTLSRSTSGLKIATGGITNTEVAAAAGIAFSKMATLTANKALATDGSGIVIATTVTATELGFLSGLTAAAQTQLDAKANLQLSNLTGTTAIPVSLIPSTSGLNLGVLGTGWANVFASGYKSHRPSATQTITTINASTTVTVASSAGMNGATVIYSSSFTGGAATVSSVTNSTTVVMTSPAIASATGSAVVTFGLTARSINELASDGGTAGLQSGFAIIRSGDTSGAMSGKLLLRTGADTTGSATTGDIFIQTGATSGTRGQVLVEANALVVKTKNGIVLANNLAASATVETTIGVDVYTLSSGVSTLTDIGGSAFLDLTAARSASIDYEVVEAATGNVRAGTLKMVSTSAGVMAINDSYAETAVVGSGTGLEFNVRYDSGASKVWLQYNNTNSNACTMKVFVVSPLSSMPY